MTDSFSYVTNKKCDMGFYRERKNTNVLKGVILTIWVLQALCKQYSQAKVLFKILKLKYKNCFILISMSLEAIPWNPTYLTTVYVDISLFWMAYTALIRFYSDLWPLTYLLQYDFWNRHLNHEIWSFHCGEDVDCVMLQSGVNNTEPPTKYRYRRILKFQKYYQ